MVFRTNQHREKKIYSNMREKSDSESMRDEQTSNSNKNNFYIQNL